MAEGVEVKVVREVDLPSVIGEATGEFFKQWMLKMSKGLMTRAPKEFGALEGSLGPGGDLAEIDSAKPPQWAKLGTKKEYAGPLNDPKTRDPHYRTHPAFAGEQTAGWFDKGIELGNENLEPLIEEMAKMIEDGWRA